jgi:hypothetical protein
MTYGGNLNKGTHHEQNRIVRTRHYSSNTATG